MYSVPDVDEVVAVAKQLGIHLSADEAALYRKHLTEQLSQLDAFVQARVEEPRPPMVSAGREPGWRPSPHEDHLNAWIWKCRIDGAAERLLQGRTARQVDISFGGDQGGSIRIPAAFCGIIGHKPTFGLVSHFGIGFGSDQSIDYTGPMTRTVEDAAAALEATAGYDPYDPRSTRDVPTRMDVLGRLADGVGGLRIGVLQEGFDDAEHDVRELVLAAVDVLAKAGAGVAKVSIPAHHAIRTAQAALTGEGALALFKTGFFGAFTRTYYPGSIIAAINN